MTTISKTTDLSHQVWCGVQLMHINSQSSVVGVVELGYLLMNPGSGTDKLWTIVDTRVNRHGRRMSSCEKGKSDVDGDSTLSLDSY